jgi:hypothetical protein
MRVDQVDAIRPPGIGLFGRVAELVQNSRELQIQFPHAGSRDERPFLFILRTGENNFILNIALHLPDIAGMGFGDIHHQEGNAISILFRELVEGGSLPPEWRSRIAAENQHHWLPLI